MTGTPAAGARERAPVPAADRRRAKRRAAMAPARDGPPAFMSPWIVGFCVFFGYPLVMNAYLSFTHYDLLSPPRWVGLANYEYLLGTDAQTWPAIRNTLWLIAFMVPLQVLFAFGMALMLSRGKRGVGFFRTVFYLPALVPPVAATLGFVYLLQPRHRARSTRCSPSSGSTGRSGSTTRPGRSRRSCCSRSGASGTR